MLNCIETVNILLVFIVKPPLNLFFKHHPSNIPQIYIKSNSNIKEQNITIKADNFLIN